MQSSLTLKDDEFSRVRAKIPVSFFRLNESYTRLRRSLRVRKPLKALSLQWLEERKKKREGEFRSYSRSLNERKITHLPRRRRRQRKGPFGKEPLCHYIVMPGRTRRYIFYILRHTSSHIIISINRYQTLISELHKNVFIDLTYISALTNMIHKLYIIRTIYHNYIICI